MWSGDAKFWSKKSPVLFPIVGTLKNNSYEYGGKTYRLGRHGFARDMEFAVTYQCNDAITFTLLSNEFSKQIYPFEFSFSIEYSLQQNRLDVSYIVENSGTKIMYFSVGAHPAFRVPLVEGTEFEDYFLLFESVENAGRYPLSEGLIETFTYPVLNNSKLLPLKKSLFYEDALVFKHLHSKSIALLSHKAPNGLKMNFDGFPYLGLWNAKDADFVCIEPWCGISDGVEASGKLSEKEGIHALESRGLFQRSWNIELF
jgi:galactose mutarotase-like enzyme